MAYQSLYRRYRSRRFGEIVGQEHVVKALRNAVRDDRVGHAYLFSGPRGTGKTSTARILAKALNCENLSEGEPCCACDPCLAIEAGTSYDLQELDAASNNKVDDVRDLISRVALGSPGRTKVYILDEVHMLTTGASNALLKTLEEPPDHVKFVLATTDPHKVLDTIRSRTQHFEFTLLPADALAEHVRWVIQDAGLDVDEGGIAHVLRVGGGSARDTLSALEQVAAAGGVDGRGHALDGLIDALAAVDTGAALAAVNTAVSAGHDPRVLGEELLRRLRDVFLARMGAPVEHIPALQREQVAGWAERLGDRQTTRALEAVGEALLEMRQAPDPRIPLEVALVRLTRAGADQSIDALAARVDQLERTLASGRLPPTGSSVEETPAAPQAAARAEPATSTGMAESGPGGRPADLARAALADQRGADPRSRPGRTPPATPSPAEVGPPASAKPPPRRPGALRKEDSTSGPESAEPNVQPATDGASAGAGVGAGETVSPEPTSIAPPAQPPVACAAPGGEPSAPSPTPTLVQPPGDGSAPVGERVASDRTGFTREGLTLAWADKVLPTLGGLAKAMYSVGRFLEVVDSTAVFALPNEAHRRKCDQKRAEVEVALSSHVGSPVTLRLVVDDGRPGERPGNTTESADRGPAAQPEEDFASLDVRELEDAPADLRSSVARLTDAFPGAELVPQDDLS